MFIKDHPEEVFWFGCATAFLRVSFGFFCTISCIEFMVARVNVFRQFICNDNNSTKLRLKLKYTVYPLESEFCRQFSKATWTISSEICLLLRNGKAPEMIMRLLLLLISYASFSRHILCPGETIVTQHKRRGFFFEGSKWREAPNRRVDFQPPVLPHVFFVQQCNQSGKQAGIWFIKWLTSFKMKLFEYASLTTTVQQYKYVCMDS